MGNIGILIPLYPDLSQGGQTFKPAKVAHLNQQDSLIVTTQHPFESRFSFPRSGVTAIKLRTQGVRWSTFLSCPLSQV